MVSIESSIWRKNYCLHSVDGKCGAEFCEAFKMLVKHTLNELIHCVIQLRLKRTKHEQANKTRIQNLCLVHRTRTTSHKCMETEFLCDSIRNTHTVARTLTKPFEPIQRVEHQHTQTNGIYRTVQCMRTNNTCAIGYLYPVRLSTSQVSCLLLTRAYPTNTEQILLTFVYVSCIGFRSAIRLYWQCIPSDKTYEIFCLHIRIIITIGSFRFSNSRPFNSNLSLNLNWNMLETW